MTTIPGRPRRVSEPPPAADTPLSHAPETGSVPPRWIIVGIVAGLFALVLLGSRFLADGPSPETSADSAGAAAVPTSTATVEPTSTATPEPTPTPACHPASYWLPQITALERRGEYRAAADTAEIATTDPELCSEEDRLLLSAKAVNLGLRALYDQDFQPTDILAQQNQLERFLDYRARATADELDFPNDAQVGLDARSRGHFFLSVRAFELAFASGESTVLDSALVSAYVSSLHDLGVWRLQHPDESIQDEGLRLFVTCHLIELEQQFGNGACQGELVEHLGSNPDNWPEPFPSPLLQAHE